MLKKSNNKGISLRSFKIIKIAVAMIIAMVASRSIIVGGFILPIITMAAGFLIVFYFKKQVKEVMADERDYEAGGVAARWAIQIFGIAAVVIMFVLYAYREINPFYEAVAGTLAYAVCFLLILYSLIFHYYEKAKFFRWKTSYIVFAAIIGIVVFLAGARLFSGEDDWICRGGEWVKHGNPSFEAPSVPCKK
ncbi:MAG: DUF2178 domain-containing protein [Candidatus Paceibacterota bacterium]